MLPLFFFVPLVAPLALLLVVALRWYWVFTPRGRHRAGLIRHLLYLALAPGALAGTIYLSWFGGEVLRMFFDFAAPGDGLHRVMLWWTDLSLWLLSKALWMTTGLHDWIASMVARTGLIADDARWLPDSWFKVHQWSAKAREALAAAGDWRTVVFAEHVPGDTLALMLLPGYFALSHWAHVAMARQYRRDCARREQERLEADLQQRLERSGGAGGRPGSPAGAPRDLESIVTRTG